MLSLPTLRRLRTAPYAAIPFVPIERCTSRCLHCSMNAGPSGTPAAHPGVVREWVASVAEALPTRVLGITGGEPFYERDALAASLDAAAARGLLTVVYTNAYWADSDHAAAAVLDDLPPLDLLEVSGRCIPREACAAEQPARGRTCGGRTGTRSVVPDGGIRHSQPPPPIAPRPGPRCLCVGGFHDD